MRHMPRIVPSLNGQAIRVPTLPVAEWDRQLTKRVGRELTAGERATADRMAAHGWPLVTVADEILRRKVETR